MPVVRIALSQFRPRKGEYADNVARIGAVITQAAQLDPKPELVVFPETATSGYFVEGGVKELAVTAGTLARDLDETYRASVGTMHPTDVVIGFYEVWRNTLYNSAMYVTLGAGEPASITTAPAVANAIFDATGARLRQVPFTPERVRAALAHPTN